MKYSLWKEKGIFILGDIFNEQGLHIFHDMEETFSLPHHSYFFYLQLRSILLANKVPIHLALPTHPVIDWLSDSRGAVSSLYNNFIRFFSDNLAVSLVTPNDPLQTHSQSLYHSTQAVPDETIQGCCMYDLYAR